MLDEDGITLLTEGRLGMLPLACPSVHIRHHVLVLVQYVLPLSVAGPALRDHFELPSNKVFPSLLLGSIDLQELIADEGLPQPRTQSSVSRTTAQLDLVLACVRFDELPLFAEVSLIEGLVSFSAFYLRQPCRGLSSIGERVKNDEGG